MPVIERILETYQNSFDLDLDARMRTLCTEFLERQLELHPEYDLSYYHSSTHKGNGRTKFPWVNWMANKQLVFTYVIGETPIIVDSEGQERKIGEDENEELKPIADRAADLVLLSMKSMGIQTIDEKNQTDPRLCGLYHQIYGAKRGFIGKHWQSWRTIIDELGSKDPVVQKYFGRQISSDDVRYRRLR